MQRLREGGTEKAVGVRVGKVKGEGLCNFCSEYEGLSPAGVSCSVICNSAPSSRSKLLGKTHTCSECLLGPVRPSYLSQQLPPMILNVTKSKLVLLAARQASKSRDELLGQGIAILFEIPADREDGGLVSQRTILPELEFRPLLY